jgi:hypothetical protein
VGADEFFVRLGFGWLMGIGGQRLRRRLIMARASSASETRRSLAVRK